ncbi:LOB domain-containing protein 27-like [Hibiscus syriacus]|uniref:LOB domain-containing protein 27-like n=1 Tax=Hibiscus syriacus TaxID=106335 RepID=UPI0019211349|nr:LOB domain-containing protein 27-like [Hibiscus syriacus]
MTLKGGATSACAACKYQRRKCIPECLLGPYFPADQTKVFQNAHKLFGVSNIVKILRSLDPSQHAEAMRSIKYQANVRDRFPVYGCLGVIRQLYYQIQLLEEELHAVLTQLEMYRQQQQQHQISSMAEDVISQLELGMAPPTTNALPLFNQVTMQNPYMDSPKENVDNNSLWIQHLFLDTNNHSNDNNDGPIAIQSELLGDDEQEVVYDEIQPFFDSMDDRQSYIDSNSL